MTDEGHMRRALDLAERGWGHVSPNPLVGAVVLDAPGEVVGEGWHEGPGTPHAEAMALAAAGPRAYGGTTVVTLEPCDHHGRTGPCTQALIDAGVARVIAAVGDPNPIVNGAGFTRLREAGIEVVVGMCETEAARLNGAFFRHVQTGRPFVVLKAGASIDGKAAAADGSSRWITSEAARADAQKLRAWADAIVVGAGTVLADDPALTVRDPRWSASRPPLRVVVDSGGRAVPPLRIFEGTAPTLVATTDRAPASRVQAWRSAGADVAVLDTDATGRVSIGELVQTLGKRDVQGVLVEGGATLGWSFVRAGLVDRVVVYLAPILVGGTAAPGVLAGDGFVPIDAALPLSFSVVERIGPDLKVEADVQRDRRREG